MMSKHRGMLAVGAAVVTLWVGTICPARAQVGTGLIDPNVATETELRALPNMTPAIVKGLTEKRPFASALELNAFLLEQKLTPAQATEFYRKAFVHINLNTGKPEEFMLVPGSGKRMSAEFAEYRPWKNWAQFDKEIGKYVGQQETDRFKQYMFIPINLNTANDEVLLTVPGANSRMVGELKQSRPWKTKEQFDKEIGKAFGPKEAAGLWRYFVIQ
jgi:DNA uptake protein ComE-like DNA-binding protein